jgi:hypothetical protein
MKLFTAVIAGAALIGLSYANAQTTPIPGPNGPFPSTDRPSGETRSTTNGAAPQAPVPGAAGNPRGAAGGAVPGVPNPDRVPAGSPGGQSIPPGN